MSSSSRLKRLVSKLARSGSSRNWAAQSAASSCKGVIHNVQSEEEEEDQSSSLSSSPCENSSSPQRFWPGENTFAVLVGRERRRYVLGEHFMTNPLFRSLLESKSLKTKQDGSSILHLPCEVVMFDHLLWMLDTSGAAFDSLDELLEFYSF